MAKRTQKLGATAKYGARYGVSDVEELELRLRRSPESIPAQSVIIKR